MRGFVRLMAVVVTAAVFVVACSKDKDSGKITLDSPAVFFAHSGKQRNSDRSVVYINSIQGDEGIEFTRRLY